MTHPRNMDVARESLLLRTLPDGVVESLLSDATTRHYAQGETVFLQGEEARSIHVVLEGWVKLYRVGPNGNEAVVNVFTKGHSFGEAIAFRGGDYPVSAGAVTDCDMLLIPARAFVTIMRREPDVCMAVLASTFQHLHQLVSQIEQIKAQTGAQRVAEFLFGLCDRSEGSCLVTLPYDKTLIAGRLGMKPESLSRAFAKLKLVGVRIARNQAMIEDVEALRTYADEDPAAAWGKAL
ncbi:MAG: Crp/Fnr family transcriptional regulator [Sediminimonas qiaohouensis]|uniref:Crp/Fnr family transcriptional regulator n=1 Tax=Sediminimonas qiaohouensis TaxID=552061 RepID=A0A7C9M6T9_9RHOB|nr:Crp/Fnr family transcriptional regulator [Sediminimonas qiaohouensis]MTJ03221.1 Crp/Fnr family transcriptional regulator [Sediminimonas qiaohouensis]